MTRSKKAPVYSLLILSVLLWAVLSDAWGVFGVSFQRHARGLEPVSLCLSEPPDLGAALPSSGGKAKAGRSHSAKAALRIPFSLEILFASARPQHPLHPVRDASHAWRMVDKPNAPHCAGAWKAAHRRLCGGAGLSRLWTEPFVLISERKSGKSHFKPLFCRAPFTGLFHSRVSWHPLFGCRHAHAGDQCLHTRIDFRPYLSKKQICMGPGNPSFLV